MKNYCKGRRFYYSLQMFDKEKHASPILFTTFLTYINYACKKTR